MGQIHVRPVSLAALAPRVSIIAIGRVCRASTSVRLRWRTRARGATRAIDFSTPCFHFTALEVIAANLPSGALAETIAVVDAEVVTTFRNSVAYAREGLSRHYVQERYQPRLEVAALSTPGTEVLLLLRPPEILVAEPRLPKGAAAAFNAALADTYRLVAYEGPDARSELETHHDQPVPVDVRRTSRG